MAFWLPEKIFGSKISAALAIRYQSKENPTWFFRLGLKFLWSRGQDLNLRPSGYEYVFLTINSSCHFVFYHIKPYIFLGIPCYLLAYVVQSVQKLSKKPAMILLSFTIIIFIDRIFIWHHVSRKNQRVSS